LFRYLNNYFIFIKDAFMHPYAAKGQSG